MTRGRRSSVHKLQTSARSVTPEPSTEAGTTPGDALYDTPPRDSTPAELGARSRKKTKKYEYYENGRSCSHSRSEKWTRTHSRNLRARSNSRASHKDVNNTTPANNTPSATQDGTADTQPHLKQSKPRGHACIAESNTQPTRRRGRKSRKSRRGIQSRSPTPVSTDDELEALPLATGQTPAGSQHTYIYETVPQDVFIQYAKNRLGPDADLKDRATSDILEMLRIKEGDQAIKMGSARHKTSIIMLSPEPVAVAGGWHQNWAPLTATGSQGGGSRPTKQGSDEFVASEGQSSKRQRAILDLDLNPAQNTDTEPESDDNDLGILPTSPTPARPVPPPAPCLVPSERCTGFALRPNLPPRRGTQAPPPTREPTASTLLDSPRQSGDPLLSRSTGDSQSRNANVALPVLPQLDDAPRDSRQGCLHAKVLARAVEELEDAVVGEEDEGEDKDGNRDGDGDGDGDGDEGADEETECYVVEFPGISMRGKGVVGVDRLSS